MQTMWGDTKFHQCALETNLGRQAQRQSVPSWGKEEEDREYGSKEGRAQLPEPQTQDACEWIQNECLCEGV